MNYIHLDQSFWKAHDQQPFSGNEVLLFMRLKHLFSEAGKGNDWPGSMRFMDPELCSKTGLSPNCMKGVRDALQQRGVIGFEPVGKGFRGGAEYWLKTPGTAPKRTSKNDGLSGEERQKDNQKEHQKDDQNLTFSHIYNESKPLQTPLTTFEEQTTVEPFVDADAVEDVQHVDSGEEKKTESEQPTIEEVRANLTDSGPHWRYAYEQLKLVKTRAEFAALIEMFITQQECDQKPDQPLFPEMYKVRNHFKNWLGRRPSISQTNHGKPNQKTPVSSRVEPVPGKSFGNWSGTRFNRSAGTGQSGPESDSIDGNRKS